MFSSGLISVPFFDLFCFHFASDLSAAMYYNFKLNTVDGIECHSCVLSLLQTQGYHKMTSFRACARSACRDCCWQRLTQISTAPSQWGVFFFISFHFILREVLQTDNPDNRKQEETDEGN